MLMALVVGASPKNFKSGGLVYLKAGYWRVRYEGVKDSEFSVRLIRQSSSQQEKICDLVDGVEIAGPAHVQVIMKKPGTEQYFSIKAEYQK